MTNPDTARRSAIVETAARGALLLVLAGVAFARTWSRVVGEVGWDSGSTLLLAAAVGAVLTAVTLHVRGRPELPIHDRQSDKIVALVVMTIALMVQWLVLPRYASIYILLHLDVAAAWTFLVGGCVLVFGLRRTGRYWPAWLVLYVASPAAIRLGVATLGGGTLAIVTVVVVVTSAGPVAVIVAGWARDRREGARRDRTRWAGPAVTRREAWRSVPLIIAVAVLLGLAPLPRTAEDRLAQGPPITALEGQVIPTGWTERAIEDFPWASRIYGPGATLQRQLIRADAPRDDWDRLRRPRQAMVQTLTVSHPGLFDIYPIEMTYDLGSARVSPPTNIELTPGLIAQYRTVIDDEQLLTWSLMSFVWTRPDDRYQRVSLLTVDNHEYDAEFPRTVPGTRYMFSRIASLLLRGRASIVVEDSEPKDLNLLTELGQDLVEAQWTTQ